MSRAGDIEQRAAEWLVRHEQPSWSAKEQRALDAWLAESLAHKAAYWRLEHGWREADRIGALGSARAQTRRFRIPQAAGWLPVALAATLVMVVVSSVFERVRPDRLPEAHRFSTAIGGRATIPLTDGSRIELNTASSVRAVITNATRQVWLDRGEAYFEIAHRNGRPFVVHAGSRTVTVLGTKFAVRRDGDTVTVSVVEGRVRVEDATRPDTVPAAIITKGDVAIARGPSTLLAAQSRERVASDLAWRDGMLDFDRTSLADAVAQFNRYNMRRIVIGDAQTGAIRIGGSFQTTNVDAFVRLLHDAYGIQVEAQGDRVKISR